MGNKLIVPFVFSHKVDKRIFAWIFCKYADFCLRNDMPMITEEEYCRDEALIDSYNSWDPQKDVCTVLAPDREILKKQLKSVVITEDERKTYLKDLDIDNSSKSRIWVSVEEHKGFEELIDKKIREVEARYGKINVIVTWIRYPALAECARKYGIKVLTQEVSSVRGGYTYKEVLGYFNFGEKYTSKTIQEGYLAVENQLDQEVVLSRKEILALILKKEHLEILNRLEDAIYEFGVDADAERDAFFGKYSDISQREIIEGVRRLIDPSNVLARYHPHTKPENPELEFDIDDSVSSLEWILKCRRIVSGISNVGFEAALAGRTAYILCEKAPFYSAGVHSLRNMEESITPIKMLNYMLFGYFAPWDLMFDVDYILWRAADPDPIEVYRRNLSYVLKKEQLDYNEMSEISQEQRIKDILSKIHGLSDNEIERFVKKSRNKPYLEILEIQESCQKKLNETNIELESRKSELAYYKNEVKTMRDSTSWRMTKPLRNGGDILRKVKKMH